MKRALDLVASACATMALSPLMLLIAVAIKANSEGPVLFAQTRVGRFGQPFRILKFRTMITDADKVGPYFTTRDDPRITRVGALLRKTSLDELPQFLNVLMGDMSIVGPRPDAPGQRTLYTNDEWQMRHSVRPGITGLAQATLRSEASPEERKRLDLEYVSTASTLLDGKILLMTVRQVFMKGSF